MSPVPYPDQPPVPAKDIVIRVSKVNETRADVYVRGARFWTGPTSESSAVADNLMYRGHHAGVVPARGKREAQVLGHRVGSGRQMPKGVSP